ncbi:MAG: hypothetical protein KGZ92_04985 [Firmicutes bacterium]|nr:hypothetical protein [Dethiobacter sp.]MBS3888641.1 hypothetical protein [Bacillota bacterium]MBS4054444.1 hypothetical protein [Thermaerobacter sp.]
MAKRYRLAQVLELKKQLEQQQMLVLSRAEKARQTQEQHLDELVTCLEGQIDLCLSPEFIEHRSMYFACKHSEVKAAHADLCELTEAREEARLDLVSAAMERRKIELHHEQFVATLRYETEARERAHADEVGSQIYLRQRVAAR